MDEEVDEEIFLEVSPLLLYAGKNVISRKSPPVVCWKVCHFASIFLIFLGKGLPRVPVRAEFTRLRRTLLRLSIARTGEPG